MLRFLFLFTCALFIVFITLSFFIPVNTENSITGRPIDGNFALSITLVGTPTLTIASPRNETYFSNESLSLRVDSNADTLWYRLDSGNNVTFSDDLVFTTSEGSHTLHVFANNTDGVTYKNVTFTVDTSLLEINYSNYSGVYSGDSTDFNQYSLVELQNVSVRIEDTRYGMIRFTAPINVTNDADPADSFVNLNTGVVLGNNSISINSTLLPNFNVPATLFFYDVSFTSPRILRDGVVCGASVCTGRNYTGGTFSVNVTGFSTYSLEETPVSSEGSGSSGGSSGGSGGSATQIDELFDVGPSTMVVSIPTGRSTNSSVILTSRASGRERVSISVSGIEDFVKVSTPYLELSPGESIVVDFDFFARPSQEPGVYLGKLIFSSEHLSKEVLVSVTINSNDPLFDILLELMGRNTPRWLDLFTGSVIHHRLGDPLYANIKLFEVRDTGQVDVALAYKVHTPQGVLVLSETETIAVFKQANFVKSFDLPPNIAKGNYLFSVEATYANATASASEFFVIDTYSFLSLPVILGAALVFILLVLFIGLRIHRVLSVRRKQPLRRR